MEGRKIHVRTTADVAVATLQENRFQKKKASALHLLIPLLAG